MPPHCPDCAHRLMRLPESLGQKESKFLFLDGLL